VSHGDVSSGLAKLLPELVNQFTPQGELPHNANALLSQVLSGLNQGR
jgi:uncharacterized protein YidB (DUF937 family)